MILLTRPLKQSQDLELCLERPCWIEPMLTVVPLSNVIHWEAYTDIIVTSLQVFEMVSPLPKHATYWCVGPKTAHHARSQSLSNVIVGPGNVQGLLEMILDHDDYLSKRFLYLRGQKITQPIADQLHQANCQTDEVIVYDCQRRESISQDLKNHLIHNRISLAPFFSSQTAQTFVHLLQKSRLITCVHEVTALALSSNIAQCLQKLPWKKILVNDLLANTLIEEYDKLTLDR